jgi:hypothetical protein
MQKVRVIIEVELVEHPTITPRLARKAWGTVQYEPGTSADPQENMVHELVLLNALRAAPAQYVEFVKARIVHAVEIIGVNNALGILAKLPDSYGAGLDILEDLIKTLPEASRQFFQPAIEGEFLSEEVALVFEAIEATPVSLTVEYPRSQPSEIKEGGS